MGMRELGGPLLSYHTKIASPDLHTIKQAGIQLLDIEKKLIGMNDESDYVDLLICTQATLQRTSTIILRLINGSRPINRLPPEILLMVFSHVPDWVPAIPEGKERLHWPFAAPRTDQLRSLTAVCSQWRKLALGDSRLWSTFWEGSSKFATSSSLHLSRCPSGPLNVFTRATQPCNVSKKLMHEHAPRIRQLHCFGSDCGTTSAEFSLMLRVTFKTVDFSMLQHLCFHELFAHDKRSALLLVTPVTAASLRSLHLCRMSLPSQSFPSLRRFVFWYPSFFDSPPIGTHSLLQFLAGVPKLEVLHLCRIRIQSGAHESAGVAPQVELCHLRYFTYDSSPKSFVDIPSLTHLLSHIHIPVHCCFQVDMILISQNVPSDDTHALMMQLLGRRNRRRLTLYLDCDIMRYNCTQAVLELQPEASMDAGEVTGGGRIRVVFDYREPSLSESLDPFLSLSLEQVEELRVTVSGSQDRSSKILARIWPRLTNVRNLAVSLRWSFYRREYLRPLHDMLDPLRASPGQPPACPRLEALDMYVPICEDPCMEAIGQTLASRAEADFQVRRLAIYACKFVHTTDSSPRRHVTHFDASRSIDQSPRGRRRSVWDRWPLLESQSPENTVQNSQTAKYDPIGTGWWTLVE